LVLAISNYADMLGGGEHSFFDLISNLPEGWKVVAVTPKYGELTRRLRDKGIETLIIPISPIRPWLIVDILKGLRAYYSVCRKYRPHLIYANGSRAALYAGIIGRILKLPTIWHCRIAQPDIYLDFLLCRMSSRIIANSRATADRFKQHFQPKVQLIYNGVDIQWLRNGVFPKPHPVQDDWKVILKVARVSKSKRHDLVLSAFEHVARSDPRVHLLCIGSKDAREAEWWDYLQEKTDRSPVATRIHWIGDASDVRPWYRSAQISVFGAENEAFGRVVVESMVCGVPVIAVRSGGVPEIVQHGRNGLLVSPGEAKEMAEAIDKLLKDEPLRERLVQSARETAKSFSLDAHVNKMVEVFEDTVGNS
jgi:glycosyltransferase involved in cell wall biosynthesis